MSGSLDRFSEVVRFLLDVGEKSLTGRWHFVAPESEILCHIHVGRIFPTGKVCSISFKAFLLHPGRLLKVLLEIRQPKGKEVANDQSQEEPDFGHLEQSSLPFFLCDNNV